MSVTNMDRIRVEYGSGTDIHFVRCGIENMTNIYQIVSTNLFQIKFIYCDKECLLTHTYLFQVTT